MAECEDKATLTERDPVDEETTEIMKCLIHYTFFSALALAAPDLLFARPVHVIPFSEQMAKADLVVIAHPGSPTVHRGDLQRKPVWTVEVTTKFRVEAVIKGDPKLREFTLLHHEYKDPVSHIEVVDGPGYIRIAKNDERPCLMFLKKAERGEYIPYCGQYDPGVSIRVMEFASHPGLDIKAARLRVEVMLLTALHGRCLIQSD